METLSRLIPVQYFIMYGMSKDKGFKSGISCHVAAFSDHYMAPNHDEKFRSCLCTTPTAVL